MIPPASGPAGAGAAAPAASVVVVTRDRAASLRRTLSALARLDHPAFEVIVVDNGSTDDTAAAAAEAGATYVRTPARAGIAASRRAGAAAARGAVVAYTDDDCIPVAGWLAALERRLLAESDLGLVGGRVDNVGFAGRRQFKGRTRLAENGETEFVEDPRDADFFGNANLAFRREAYEEIGGYDPFFSSGRAEIDLAMSFRGAGYRVAYEPEAAVEHHHEAVSLRHGRLFRGHQLMRLYFFLKHLRPRGTRAWLGFAGYETKLILRDIRRALRAAAAAVVRGRWRRLSGAGVELFNLASARLAIPWLLWRARRRRAGVEGSGGRSGPAAEEAR